MLHKKLSILVLGLVAVLSMGMVAMAQDSEGGVPILLDGDEIESFLSTEIQTRAYVFNGNEGDEVTITMETDNEDLNTFLAVMGTDGVLLGSNDNEEEDDYSSSVVEAELPTTGSYIIIASSYEFIDNILEFEGGDDEMDFTLSVEGNTEVEDLADGFALTYEEMADGDSFDGELDEDVHAIFYVFAGEEGDVVNITMETDEFNSAVHVFDPNGERIALGHATQEDPSSYVEELELPADGTYLIMATDIFFYNALVEDEDIPYLGGEFNIELNLD